MINIDLSFTVITTDKFRKSQVYIVDFASIIRQMAIYQLSLIFYKEYQEILALVMVTGEPPFHFGNAKIAKHLFMTFQHDTKTYI